MGRVEEITDVALRLLGERPWESIGLRDIAAEIGIRAPSLYKHVAGKRELAALVAEKVLRDVGERLHRAQTVEELLVTYRAIAVGSPYAFELLTGREFPRELLPAGLEDWAGEPFYLNAGGDNNTTSWAWVLVWQSATACSKVLACSKVVVPATACSINAASSPINTATFTYLLKASRKALKSCPLP